MYNPDQKQYIIKNSFGVLIMFTLNKDVVYAYGCLAIVEYGQEDMYWTSLQ